MVSWSTFIFKIVCNIIKFYSISGSILQYFREMCVLRSLMFCLDTKTPWCKYRCNESCGLDSLLEYVQKLRTSLLLWQHFHAPKHDAAQNETWSVALPVSHMASVPRPSAINLKDWLRKTKEKGYWTNEWMNLSESSRIKHFSRFLLRFVLLKIQFRTLLLCHSWVTGWQNYRFDKCLCKGRTFFSAHV